MRKCRLVTRQPEREWTDRNRCKLVCMLRTTPWCWQMQVHRKLSDVTAEANVLLLLGASDGSVQYAVLWIASAVLAA